MGRHEEVEKSASRRGRETTDRFRLEDRVKHSGACPFAYLACCSLVLGSQTREPSVVSDDGYFLVVAL